MSEEQTSGPDVPPDHLAINPRSPFFDADKLQKQGTHVVVFPGRGSHADLAQRHFVAVVVEQFHLAVAHRHAHVGGLERGELVGVRGKRLFDAEGE